MDLRHIGAGWVRYLSVTHSQWAVGAGFFHSQEISIQLPNVLPDRRNGFYRPVLGIVYDCGSSRAKAVVEREVRAFRKRHGSKQDLLFISHFDRDHVSGLPVLREQGVTFRRVFAPLLTPEERLIAFIRSLVALEEANSERDPDVDQFYRELIADPRGTLELMGGPVELVAARLGREGDEEGDGDELPPLNLIDVEQEDQVMDIKLELSRQAGKALLTASDASHSGSGTALWEFKYVVLKHVQLQQEQFLGALATELQRPLEELRTLVSDPAWLLDLVTNFQPQLRLAYDSLSGLATRNDTSLCLYSGPAVSRDSYMVWRSRGLHRHRERPEVGVWRVSPGWLGAGDAPLASQGNIAEFNGAFGTRKPNVGCLALPHHGSRHNHSDHIFDGFGTPPTSVVGADGLHDHPHLEVILSAAARGSSMTIVTSDKASRSVESCTVRFK